MLRGFRQQVDPLDGEVSRDKLEHPLLVRIGEAYETLCSPDGRRQRSYQVLETFSDERSFTQYSQGVKVVMNRRLTVMRRWLGEFSLPVKHEVVIHGPVFSREDSGPWIDVLHLDDQSFEGRLVR